MQYFSNSVIAFIFLLQTYTTLASDPHNYTCSIIHPFKRNCKHYDYNTKNCFWWNVTLCPEPFITRKWSHCTEYICEVISVNKDTLFSSTQSPSASGPSTQSPSASGLSNSTGRPAVRTIASNEKLLAKGPTIAAKKGIFS